MFFWCYNRSESTY